MKKNYLTMIITFLVISLSINSLGQRQMENLSRGLVAIRTSSSQVFVNWRMLGTEYNSGATFNLYSGSTRIASNLNTTNYVHNTSSNGTYTVRAVINGSEQASSAAASIRTSNYLDVALQIPPGGTTPSGESYTYSANDCSAADLDGDGEYEIVLKWDPSNSKDNSQSGYTGNQILDAYKLNGTRMWRIDLGINIRSGAHYTQFMVYDLDGDGKAEVACKTAPGTRAGTGSYLSSGPAASDNDAADYRNSSGYILTGPEYLTIFNGQTGAERVTVNYEPPRGTVSDWGDSYGNRVDRFLACIAYLDGSRPSLVMCRGYYTRTVLVAYDFRNGSLTRRWTFDSNSSGNGSYAGQGNHNLSVADADADGKDEIIYGSCAINDNGTGMWTTGLGHGDALHVSDINTSRSGLEVWGIHEGSATPGSALLDARTGQILWQTANADVGRGVAADLTGSYAGMEVWGGTSGLRTSTNGSAGSSPASSNHLIWWDGDELRELLDGTSITKYGGSTLLSASGCASNNGSKSNPALTADIFGDWREEAIWRTSDSRYLRIFSSTTTTSRRMYTMMHDPQYRLSIAWQNTGYNQPPHTGFFFGSGMSNPPNPNITLVGGTTPNNPPSVSISSPANGATFTSGANITVSANASDSDGSISKVEFYQGSAKLGEDASSPFAYTWNNVAAGTYSLTARATDNDGATSTSSAVTITVNQGGTGTTITIQENQTGFCSVDGTVDNNNSGFTSDGFANTSNTTGTGIDWKVNFSTSGTYTFGFRYATTSDRPARLIINGSTVVSSIGFPSTGSWTTWSTVSANATVGAGTFDVRLEATGSSGLANIDYITVTGNTPSAASCSGTTNNPPSVSITAPSNGASYTAGTNITIGANASDNDGNVTLVEFFQGSVKLGEDATSPYSYTWNNVAAGNYSLTARATDNGGAVTTSSAISIAVTSNTCNPTTITPYIQIDGGTWQQASTVTVNAGSSVKFGPQPVSGGSWNWSGPNNFSATTREVTISNIQTNQAGTYVATYTNDCGTNSTQNFVVTVNGGSTPVTLTIQENTTGFCSVDGTVDNNNSGFTGTGFANTTNASGMGITWSVSIPASGSYTLKWRHANGGSADRTAQLMVDGSTVASGLNFPATGSWTTWSETSGTNVTLSAGTRLIRLQATTSGGLSNIDYFIITGNNPQPVSCTGQKSTMNSSLTNHGLNIEIFPNPVTENQLEAKISIEKESILNMYIYNAAGELVITDYAGLCEAGLVERLIDVGNLTPGLYVLMIQSDNGYKTVSFIKQ
ncbi:MAG: carbohydrate-binding protein [Bacteroidales bacterium]|nr:carbohydrate-binding protein [Bacteroidales bacterium]